MPKEYNQELTPGICKCVLIWKRGLCEYRIQVESKYYDWLSLGERGRINIQKKAIGSRRGGMGVTTSTIKGLSGGTRRWKNPRKNSVESSERVYSC